MKARNRIVIVAAITLALLGGTALQDRAGVRANDVGGPAAGPGQNTVTARGQVVPRPYAHLAFPNEGQVAEILVTEGQRVKAGDPLVRLDASREEIRVQLAQAGVLQAKSNHQTALAELAMVETDLDAANLTASSAETQLALLNAGPGAEEIALQQAVVGVASAEVQNAAGIQALVLEGSGAAALSAAQAALTAAQSQLFVVRQANQPTAEDETAEAYLREQAQLRINAAEAEVTAAQAAYDELLAGATEAERREAASAVGAADGRLRAAKAQLDLLLAGSRPEVIAVAQAQLNQAQHAVVEATIAVEQAEAAVAEAEARVREADTGVQEAQARLSQTLLTAPIAGTVADLTVKPGDMVQPAMVVLTVADMSDWQVVTVDLDELDIVKVRPDDPVDVQLDAFPGRLLRGQILQIATAAGQSRGRATYVITIELLDSDLPLRWGMTCLVTVHINGDEG